MYEEYITVSANDTIAYSPSKHQSWSVTGYFNVDFEMHDILAVFKQMCCILKTIWFEDYIYVYIYIFSSSIE